MGMPTCTTSHEVSVYRQAEVQQQQQPQQHRQQQCTKHVCPQNNRLVEHLRIAETPSPSPLLRSSACDWLPSRFNQHQENSTQQKNCVAHLEPKTYNQADAVNIAYLCAGS